VKKNPGGEKWVPIQKPGTEKKCLNKILITSQKNEARIRV